MLGGSYRQSRGRKAWAMPKLECMSPPDFKIFLCFMSLSGMLTMCQIERKRLIRVGPGTSSHLIPCSFLRLSAVPSRDLTDDAAASRNHSSLGHELSVSLSDPRELFLMSSVGHAHARLHSGILEPPLQKPICVWGRLGGI